MKKLSLLLLVLALGAAGAYGQMDEMEIHTTFTITGEATATAGYDLDDQVFGFKNASSSDISIQIVPKTTEKNDAMDGWHGSIELKDFQILIDSNEEESEEFLTHETTVENGELVQDKARTGLYVKAPDIVAKLANGPLFLKIFAAPGNAADVVSHIEDDEDDDRKAEGHDKDKDVGKAINKGHGITIGYDTDDLDLSVGVSSEEEFKENKDSTYDKGSYAVSADLAVHVGPAKLDMSFVQGIKNDMDENKTDDDKDNAGMDDDDTGIGAKLTTTFGDIELSAGADIKMTGVQNVPETAEDESMDWEAGANAMVALTENTDLKADFILSSIEDVASDVAVNLTDKSGLVQDLDLSLKWGLFDISGGNEGSESQTENHLSDLLVQGMLDYHLDALGGTLTPGTTVTVNQLDGETDHTYLGLELRAVLKGAIPATEFGLKWESDQLLDSGPGTEQGTVSLWTKIKY